MSTYLVTGVAGFIGSKVAEFLLADGHTVIGVDNLNGAYDVRLKYWRLDQIKDYNNFEFHRLDITDLKAIRPLFASKFDAVINLAARAGVRYSVENPWVYYETNVTGTLNLLELCRQYEVKKFVLASSSSVYGDSTKMPYREDQPTDHPLSPYAASKKAAEVLCYTYHYLYGIDVTVFRYFTVYGPAGRPDMMPFRMVQWISEGRPVTVFGDGSQSRDFTYVDDIARGTIAGLESVGYEIINLGSDTPIALIDIINVVEELIGKAADIVYKPRHPADVLRTWANTEKAQRLLQWKARMDIRDGFVKLVDWYQDNQIWACKIETGKR